MTQCGRCNGQGNIPAHANVLGGICFKCAGTGFVKATASAINLVEMRREQEARREAARIEDDRKAVAAVEIYANHPSVRFVTKRNRQVMAIQVARDLGTYENL